MLKQKKIIGVLGGIGAGKSTVAGCFAPLGCAVVEADGIAHGLLEEADVKESIVRLFGGGILDKSGRVDRAALGRKVFSDAAALEKLNALIHPRVMAEVERQIGIYQADGAVQAIVLDVPLLAEVGRTDLCDVLVFVEADEAIRRQRAKENGKFDENELKKRENFQISLDTKREIADYIIYNNSDNSDVAEQVAQLFSSIMSHG
ncbi:MAG: dephospho-CoA kinase [Smithella sp.]|nr:dephospho-CoA kinase [Smithella sp.]NLW84450.1 dephospho-CoA kinase [Phycisphaerae bacterium]